MSQLQHVHRLMSDYRHVWRRYLWTILYPSIIFSGWEYLSCMAFLRKNAYHVAKTLYHVYRRIPLIHNTLFWWTYCTFLMIYLDAIQCLFCPLLSWDICVKTLETKEFFQFEIITNVLVISSRCVWIPMLWIYDHYHFCNSFSVGIVFRRQILTSKGDPRAARVSMQCHERYLSLLYINTNMLEKCPLPVASHDKVNLSAS